MARDFNLPDYSENVSSDGRSPRREDLIWTKGFRRIPRNTGRTLTRSELFVGPRLFVKHYPDGRADEYVYADAEPRRIKVPVIIVMSAFCSLILPLLGRNAYNDITLGNSSEWYLPPIIAIVIFLVILGVLVVKYFKEKDIIYEEMPAGADPREKGKNYSGNFRGNAEKRETPVYNEQSKPRIAFSSVSLILLIVLILAGLGVLGFGAGMSVTQATDNGFAVFFMILGGFWILMSLVGFASSISSLVNAKRMMKKLPPPPAAEKKDDKPSDEAKSDDDEDYKRMKRQGFE